MYVCIILLFPCAVLVGSFYFKGILLWFFLLFNIGKSKCNKMQIVLAIFLAVQEMDLLTACVADVGL